MTDQHFVDSVVFLDGRQFTGCRFERCRLVFTSWTLCAFERCHFGHGTTWEFTGPAALTIALLQGLGRLSRDTVLKILELPSDCELN